MDGQALADQLVSDKADLELELEKAKEKEAEIIRDRDKLKINLVALEDKLNDTNNEIESLKDGKLDKQKIKELIAEETAELHDIIDDTCDGTYDRIEEVVGLQFVLAKPVIWHKSGRSAVDNQKVT